MITSCAPLSLGNGGLFPLERRTTRWNAPAQPVRRARATVAEAATDGADSPFFRYFPAKDSDIRADLQVIGLGRATARHGEEYPPGDHPNLYRLDWRTGRVLPEFQVLLLTDACGEFESEETGRVRLEGDVVVFLFPGVWHRYRPDRDGSWREQWISLDGSWLKQLTRTGILSPKRAVIDVSEMAGMQSDFDRVIDIVQQNTNNHSESLSRVALGLLRRLLLSTRLIPAGDGDRFPSTVDFGFPTGGGKQDEIVKQALEIIWNHRHVPPLNVNDVARQLPVTRRTLDRRFAEQLQRSVLDEINMCRLSRAKRLLAETDLLIKTISYLSGFPSRERMRLAFLSEAGMTPSEYREQTQAAGLTRSVRLSEAANASMELTMRRVS